MKKLLVIDGNSVYEIDEDWERMSVNERRKREDLVFVVVIVIR